MTTWRRASILVALAATVAASLLIAFTANRGISSNAARGSDHLKYLKLVNPRLNSPFSGAEDPDLMYLRSDSDADEEYDPDRKNCQIVMILGVEGSVQHEFYPILTKLARAQVDIPDNTYRSQKLFRRAVYSMDEKPSPAEVKETISQICPKDGRARLYISAKSWPFGLKHRDAAWKTMTPLEISTSEVAMNEPTNLYAMWDAYSPFAEVRFIVLHRPYLETIAMYKHRDGGVKGHSNVIRGHMLLLREFLDSHTHDMEGNRLWTVLCSDHLMSRNFVSEDMLVEARRDAVRQLAGFLGWGQEECPDCFDDWMESTQDTMEILGGNAAMLRGHMHSLVGVWPPQDYSLPGQQCRM